MPHPAQERPEQDAPLTMDQAAASLGVSRKWLQSFLPGQNIGYLVAGHKTLSGGQNDFLPFSFNLALTQAPPLDKSGLTPARARFPLRILLASGTWSTRRLQSPAMTSPVSFAHAHPA